jgi:hypothetical protein
MPGTNIPPNRPRTSSHRARRASPSRRPHTPAAARPLAQTPKNVPAKSALQLAWGIVKNNPKRTLLAIGGLALSIGLCAIPGAPLLIIGALLVAGFAFAAFHMYLAAMDPPALPEGKKDPTPAQAAPAPRRSPAPRMTVPVSSAAPTPTPPAPPKKEAAVQALVEPAAPVAALAGAYTAALEARCEKMSKPGTYGDMPEIVALSNIFGRVIHIYSSQKRSTAVSDTELHYSTKVSPESKETRGPDIYLIHRHVSASHNLNHFDRLLATPEAETVPGSEWDIDGRRERIPGDGNCLFSAIARAVGSTPEAARDAAVRWMRINPTVEVAADMPLDKYCDISHRDGY